MNTKEDDSYRTTENPYFPSQKNYQSSNVSDFAGDNSLDQSSTNILLLKSKLDDRSKNMSMLSIIRSDSNELRSCCNLISMIVTTFMITVYFSNILWLGIKNGSEFSIISGLLGLTCAFCCSTVIIIIKKQSIFSMLSFFYQFRSNRDYKQIKNENTVFLYCESWIVMGISLSIGFQLLSIGVSSHYKQEIELESFSFSSSKSMSTSVMLAISPLFLSITFKGIRAGAAFLAQIISTIFILFISGHVKSLISSPFIISISVIPILVLYDFLATNAANSCSDARHSFNNDILRSAIVESHSEANNDVHKVKEKSKLEEQARKMIGNLSHDLKSVNIFLSFYFYYELIFF
jgi:hypothetical protein